VNGLINKLFLVVFFSLIISSIFVTYEVMIVEKDYRSFSDQDEIPRPSDFYFNLISNIR